MGTCRKLIVQIFSDIHIELQNKLPEISIKAKYLFLSGDICNGYKSELGQTGKLTAEILGK